METKKTSLRKKLLIGFSALILLFFASVSLLPSFLSTEKGKKMLTRFLSDQKSGTFTIEHLSLSWSGPQEIQGLNFKSTDGKTVFLSEKINSETSLIKALFSSHDIGTVHILRPNLSIQQTLIETPLKEPPHVQEASLIAQVPLNSMLPLFHIPFVGTLEIHEGKITILSENAPPIIFDPIEGSIFANKPLSKAHIYLEAQTLQNEVAGSLLIDSSFESTNSLERSLKSSVSLKHFPIDGLDQILSLKFPEYRFLLKELIGPSLDMDCYLLSSKDACNATIAASSNYLHVQGQIELQEDAVVLTSPASFTLSLSPSFLIQLKTHFPLLKEFPSSSPVKISTSLNALRVPKKEEGLLLEEASFLAALEITPFALDSFTVGCKGNFSSESLSLETVGDLQFLFQKKDFSSLSNLQISCKNLFKEKMEPTYTGSLEIGKIPTSLIGFAMETPVSEFLGDFVQGSASFQGTAQKAFITAQLTSPLLQTETASFLMEGNRFSLVKSWQIHYEMLPSNPLFSTNITLQKKTPVTAVFSEFILDDVSSWKDLKCKVFVTAAPFVLPKAFSLSSYSIDNLAIHCTADTLSNLSLEMESSRLFLHFKGGFEKESRTLFWQKPINIEYVLSEQDFHQIYPRKEKLSLLEKTPLSIQIDPSRFSLSTPSLDQLQLTAHLQSDSILLENKTHKEQFQIKDLQSSFHLTGAKDALDYTFSAEVLSSFGSGKIASTGSLKELSADFPLLKANLELQKFPLEMIDPFLKPGATLTPLLGSPFDLKMAVQTKSDVKELWIDGRTPLLKLSGALTLTPQGLFLSSSKKPVQIEFILTPEGYNLVSQKTGSPFALSENALFQASLSKLNIPFLQGTQTPDLSYLVIKGDIANDQIRFHHKGNQKSLELQNTRLSVLKKDETTPLSLILDTLTQDSQRGSLHLEAQLQKLLDEKGNFQVSQIHSDLVASFQRFPSDVLEIVFPPRQKGMFSNLLGSSFDMTLKASLQNTSGPLALTLNSPTTRVSLAGELRSGTLTLKQNAIAQLALTPETSKAFLEEGLNPLSISSLYSSTPLTFEVDAKGFSLPLFPFVSSNVEIPKGKILLGKVFCRNEGNLNLMLGLLKAKQTSQSSELELWFTPIDFQVQKGIINLERTEILVAGTYDIALWGKVNIPSNKVNMILGLTASCLRQAFNIKDLPQNYVLHIPLTGTLDHIELNKSVATSKIVALTLWQSKSSPAAAAGPLGSALVGGLLNKVLAPPGNEGSTPPAKTPYPWQSR